MRKIGIETNAYFGFNNYENGFLKMKDHGYNCADYQGFVDTDNELYSLSDDEFKEYLENVKEAAKKADVEIYQLHGPWRYPPRDNTKEERAERLEKFKKALLGAKILGCKHVVVHPIMPDENFIELNKEFYSELLKEAERLDVYVCLENMPFPTHPIKTAKDILDFVNEMNHPNFKICLDTGHSLVCDEDPAEALTFLGDKLVCMHVHDNDGVTDRHWPPFTNWGKTDWVKFRDNLRKYHPNIPLILETSYANHPVDTREHFERGLVKVAEFLAK